MPWYRYPVLRSNANRQAIRRRHKSRVTTHNHNLRRPTPRTVPTVSEMIKVTMQRKRMRSDYSILGVLVLMITWIPSCVARKRKDGNPLSRGIVVKNQSKSRIDYFWINPDTGKLAASTTDGGVVHGADSSVQSYIGHTFEVHELPKKKTGKCVESVCRKTQFTVSSNEDQSTNQ